MASTDSRPLPLKNTAFRLYFTAYDSSGVPVTAFTSPDSERSLDGAAFADCTNEATYVGHGQGYIDLTTTEMNTDHTGFYFSCSEGSTRDCISICPAQNDSIPTNVKQINGTAQTARDIGASVLLSDGTGTGQIDLSSGLVNVATLAANSITSSVIATDAIGNLQVADGFITQSKLNTGCIGADALALDAVQEITADVVAVMAVAPVGSVAGNVVGNVQGSVGSVSSFGTLVADIWSYATRLLTAGTNIVLAKGTGVTGFNDPTVAAIADAVCDEAVADHVTAGTVGAQLASIYAAQIDFSDDEANTQDEYSVQWFKNGAPVTSGITSPTIQVIKRADGTDLVASAAMTEIGSTGAYKYDATAEANRISAGEAVLVHVAATIDGSSRTWRKVISRDSAAA